LAQGDYDDGEFGGMKIDWKPKYSEKTRLLQEGPGATLKSIFTIFTWNLESVLAYIDFLFLPRSHCKWKSYSLNIFIHISFCGESVKCCDKNTLVYTDYKYKCITPIKLLRTWKSCWWMRHFDIKLVFREQYGTNNVYR
jgi:hypothetical protein